MRVLLLTLVISSSSARAQCPSDDTFAGTSAASSILVSESQIITGLRAVQGAPDWFCVEVPAGESVVVATLFDHDLGDISLYAELATNPDGAVAFSAGEVDVERIEIFNTGQVTQSYNVEVLLYPGICNDYSLDVSYRAPHPCTTSDDGFEPNDVSAAATALNVPGTTGGLISASGNEDWYTFDIAAGSDLELRADFLHGQGDIDLFLYDSAQLELARSNGFTNGEELFLGPSPVQSTYYLKVVRKDSGCSTYSLTIDQPFTAIPVLRVTPISPSPTTVVRSPRCYRWA